MPRASAYLLFLAAISATFAIGLGDPRVDYAYEFAAFSLAVGWCLRGWRKPLPLVPAIVLAVIAAWGFFQLAVNATVYRLPTLQSALRFSGLAATAWASFRTFGSRESRATALQLMAWIGVVVAIVSVLAYFTSPGELLWTVDAPYPDIWGPFLSRNNFAQFLELLMPVALWLALEDAAKSLYLIFAAVMLASGLASASRAGAAVLVVEATAVLWLRRQAPAARRMAAGLVFSSALAAAVPGTGNLVGRLMMPDPFGERREIAHSAVNMIASRPWIGFGLGTFATVYPEYALFDEGRSVDHAHNDWLEWAAEGGLFFALMWAGLAIWSVRPAIRSGWGLGLLGVFAHGVVDYPFARFGISAWALILIGMLAASDVREVRHRVH